MHFEATSSRASTRARAASFTSPAASSSARRAASLAPFRPARKALSACRASRQWQWQQAVGRDGLLA
jgi:hypothetical protein